MASKRRKAKEAEPATPAVATHHPRVTDKSKELVELFKTMQLDEMSTVKAVGKMKKIFDDSERDNFFDHMVFMLQVPLVNGTSKERPNKFDEKILQVVARFAAASLEDNAEKSVSLNDSSSSTAVELPWILRKTFDWLLDHHKVQSSCARLRICMMINWLLKNLGLNAEIDEVLYQKIHDNMMVRLQDKVAEIRAQAVTALQRLQDPFDCDCPIIRGYLRHLKFDPSALVRRTIINCIGASRITLKAIMDRTRDIDDSVRKAAFHLIAEKISIKIFSIGEREELLRQGLSDRNPGVRKVVEKELVPSWLRNCNGNIVEVLHAIDVGNSDGKTAADICKAIFTDVPYDQLLESFKYLDPTTKVVPLKKLTPETVTYWKNLAAYFNEQSEKGISEDADANLDKLLPELTRYCNYVRDYVANHMGKVPPREDEEEPDEEEIAAYEVAGAFVLEELIEMSAYFDMADEVGRQNLCRLCKELLGNRRLHAGFVEPIMKIYNIVQKNPETRIQEIAEIISDLRDPLLSSQQLLQLQQQQLQQQQQQIEQQRLLEQQQKEAAEQLNKSLEELDEKRREEEQKRAQAEAKKNEEALRKKRVQLAKIRLRMNIVKNDLDTAVQNQEFVIAQEKKVEFETISEEEKVLLGEIEQATAVHLTPKEPERVRQVLERPPPPPPDSPILSQPLTQTQKDDPVAILKSLTMLANLMRCSDIVELNPTLQTLLDEFITNAVRDLNFEIREVAVKAMGCACLRSIKAAKKHLLIILSMAHLDVPIVRCQALKVVVDLLMWHGLSAFISASDNSILDDDDDDENDRMSTFSFDNNRQVCSLTQADLNSQGGDSVVTVLCQLLDDPDIDIRTSVAEGLCKLILCGAIVSHKLITRLILIWCNPVNEPNVKMKTVLGMFFPLYASLSRANQEMLEESFMGTMKTLIEAPETSPLAKVNLEDIGFFYIQLTRPEQLQESCRDDSSDSTVHDSMALTISNYMISTPDSFYLKSFAKFLLNLQISTSNYPHLRDLRDLQNQIVEKIPDKLVSKTIEKFRSRLEEFIAQDPEPTANEEQEKGNEVPVNRRGSLGRDCISIADAPENNTNVGMTAKKRTLFSDTQNTMLDTTFASPAGVVRKKGRFTSLLPAEDVTFMPQMFSSQASSTLRPVSTSSLMDLTSKRSGNDRDEDEDSDPEIEFKRPQKIIRTKSPPTTMPGGAANILDDINEVEEIVSGNLKPNKNVCPKKDVELASEPLTEFLETNKQVQLAKLHAQIKILKGEAASALEEREFYLAQMKQLDLDTITEEARVLSEQIKQANGTLVSEPEPDAATPGNEVSGSAEERPESSDSLPFQAAENVESEKPKKSKSKKAATSKVKDSATGSSSEVKRKKVLEMNLTTSSEDDFILPPKRPNRGKSRRETLLDILDSPLKSGADLTMTGKNKKKKSSSSQSSTKTSSQSNVSDASQNSEARRSSRSRQSHEDTNKNVEKKKPNSVKIPATGNSGRSRRSQESVGLVEDMFATSKSSSSKEEAESLEGRPRRSKQLTRKARESLESASGGKRMQRADDLTRSPQDANRGTKELPEEATSSEATTTRVTRRSLEKNNVPVQEISGSEGRVKRSLINSRLSDKIAKVMKADSPKSVKNTNDKKADSGARPRRILIDNETSKPPRK